ncbi:TPA: DUF551 domain-containing protein [Enterobacter ludwigii]|nr:DUF551 domain-containing protein [Enterobacter ludwigii]
MSTYTKEQLIARINQVTAINKYRISRDPDADGLAMDNELARIALASLEAEERADPVAFINGAWTLVYYRPPKELGLKIGDKLYTAPPAKVSVPAELTREEYKRRFMEEDDFDATFRGGWNACRSAMLQGADGNSTVIQDGWVACSERMPAKGQEVLCTDRFENYETALYDTGYIPGPPFFATTAGEFHPTHWMPLPTPPKK